MTGLGSFPYKTSSLMRLDFSSMGSRRCRGLAAGGGSGCLIGMWLGVGWLDGLAGALALPMGRVAVCCCFG